MIYIYSIAITSTWSRIEQELLEFVSVSRREKISKYYLDEDKKLSLYAALFIRMQTSIFTNIPIEKLSFSHTLYNKPILLNVPDYHFNISHTKSRILCAISSRPIGIDVEKNTNAPFEVMSLVFHPDEIAYVQSGTSEFERNTRFFIIWTKKEALVKCIGTGLTNDVSNINTLALDYISNFHTWKNHNYICSVYSDDSINTCAYKFLLEKDIQRYFLEYL